MNEDGVNTINLKKESDDYECDESSSCSSSDVESLSPSDYIRCFEVTKVWMKTDLLHQTFDEQRQLLCTEEESSDKHSSDEEFDVWMIQDEQREYYTNYFLKLQPDITKKITGSVAKHFFEKSKLSSQELCKIWKLSDITKDGALSLEEFLVAMHLIVLRKNNFEIPDALPFSLQFKDENTDHEVSKSDSRTNQWTRFFDSPTDTSSNDEPSKFESSQSLNDQVNSECQHSVSMNYLKTNSEKQQMTCKFQNIYSLEKESSHKKTAVIENDLKSVQRPTPKKLSAPSIHGLLPPPPIYFGSASETESQSMPLHAGYIEARNNTTFPKGHARSSSLDLNKLDCINNVPPAIPPRELSHNEELLTVEKDKNFICNEIQYLFCDNTKEFKGFEKSEISYSKSNDLELLNSLKSEDSEKLTYLVKNKLNTIHSLREQKAYLERKLSDCLLQKSELQKKLNKFQ